ncbi:hypothetical protein [Streptomyces sp. NRRL F-525]|nr:hypothetical protein [Streptomyces sp. NRRL F-525]
MADEGAKHTSVDGDSFVYTVTLHAELVTLRQITPDPGLDA